MDTTAIPQKRWVYKPLPSKEQVQALREQLNLSEVTATLLLQRNITTYEQAFHFFRDTLNDLHDPFLMDSMQQAVERLAKAIDQKEKILFYGDYDVDGTTSVSLMVAFFRDVFPEIPCDFYVPDRYTEGYGLSERGVDFAAKEGFSLLVTLDCGIRAIEQVAYAKQQGIDVIVCDHHEPGEQLPEALAILDPKIPGNPYPFKELSGCGVGFKLLQGLCIYREIAMEHLYVHLDFVAISAACDIVPIVGENRILVREGLKRINQNPRLSVATMIEVAGFKNALNVSNLVFGIGPRINAAGRIAHANHAVRLLLSAQKEEALELAKSVNVKNELRKDYDAQITEEALAMIAAKPAPFFSNVLFKPDWHKGVIGIVASRCIEKYHCPTIILTESNGKATGSARSIEGFDVHQAISECAELLDKFGGHVHAAGLTLPLENIAAFQQKFEEVAAANLSQEQLIPHIEIDLKVSIDQITMNLYELMEQMAPFGPQNLQPIFGSEEVLIVGEVRVLKEKHLKFQVCQKGGKNTMDAIGFNMVEFLPYVQSGEPLRLCFQLSLNEFMGNTSLQLLLRDIQPMAAS